MEMNNGLNIDISRPAPLYLQVKQNILQLIDRGELKDGDRLPPEIELARICNLSRGTVRMALSELAREGLVSRSPKRGSFLTLEKSDTSARIGVLSPLFVAHNSSFPDFFQAELVSGIREGALKKGATLLFLPNVQERWSANCRSFSDNPDVLLFLIPRKSDISLICEIERTKTPCIALSAAVGNNFNYVASANFKGSVQAMEYLFSLGHRRIGLVINSFEGFDAQERYDGYRRALKNKSIPFEKELVRVVKEVDSTRWQKAAAKATAEILKTGKPTAIFAPGSNLALGAKEAIEEAAQALQMSAESFAKKIIAQFCKTIKFAVDSALQKIHENPVYTIKELLSDRTLKPESFGVIGGPAEALRGHLQREFIVYKYL